MKQLVPSEITTETLLAKYGENNDPRIREQIIERMEPLVRSLAHKFARPGVPVEDLIQTAWVALIGALDRFDPSHHAKFSTYAVHCMVGEIKRYFRDRTWLMRAPRQLQEIAVRLHRVEDELYRRFQRAPTVSEMAVEFGVSEDDLVQAMEMSRANQAQGLDDRREMGDGHESLAISETVGSDDTRMEELVEQAPLREALTQLDPRRARIVQRRFFDGYTQREVAAELGLSQMHVSRLERSALRQLQGCLNASSLPPASPA
jgi:RNA polymerase sigma-B factor